MSLANRLNFSAKKENDSAIEIRKWHSVAYYDTLCQYCAENNIDLSNISDSDFESCADIMAEHGQSDKSTDHYFFWIDAE